MKTDQTGGGRLQAYADALEFASECSDSVSCQDLLQRARKGLWNRFGLRARVWEGQRSSRECTRMRSAFHANDGDAGERFHFEAGLQGGPCLCLEVSSGQAAVFTRCQKQILEILTSYLFALYSQLKQIDHLRLGLVRRQLVRSQAVPNEFVSNRLPFESLTQRERQLVECLQEGLSNPDTARRLGISRRTVEKHFQNIFSKLKLENRYQLLAELRHAPA